MHRCRITSPIDAPGVLKSFASGRRNRTPVDAPPGRVCRYPQLDLPPLGAGLIYNRNCRAPGARTCMMLIPGGRSFGMPEVVQTVRLLSASALAYGAATMFGLPDRFWAMVTAVVVTQPMLQATLAAGLDRVLGTVLGAVAGLSVIFCARHGLPESVGFCTALVLLAIVTAVWPNMRLSCITLIVVVLVPSNGLSFSRPIDRVLEILLGTLVAVIASAAVLPKRRSG